MSVSDIDSIVIKSCIRETVTISTDADSSTDTIFFFVLGSQNLRQKVQKFRQNLNRHKMADSNK